MVLSPLLTFFLFSLLCGVFAAILANSKNRNALGWFFAGVLFGPFGLLVGLMPELAPTPAKQAIIVKPLPKPAPPNTFDCPHCLQSVHERVTRCPHCHEEITPGQLEQAIWRYVRAHPPALVPTVEEIQPPDTPPDTPPRSRTIAERLRNLEQLRAQALISTDEYEQKRSELLKEI